MINDDHFDPYEPDDEHIEYVEIETASGCRICFPLDWFDDMAKIVKDFKVLYSTDPSFIYNA